MGRVFCSVGNTRFWRHQKIEASLRAKVIIKKNLTSQFSGASCGIKIWLKGKCVNLIFNFVWLLVLVS